MIAKRLFLNHSPSEWFSFIQKEPCLMHDSINVITRANGEPFRMDFPTRLKNEKRKPPIRVQLTSGTLLFGKKDLPVRKSSGFC